MSGLFYPKCCTRIGGGAMGARASVPNQLIGHPASRSRFSVNAKPGLLPSVGVARDVHRVGVLVAVRVVRARARCALRRVLLQTAISLQI